jgi:hypothetical protein
VRDHHKDEPHISTIPPKTAAGTAGVLTYLALPSLVKSSFDIDVGDEVPGCSFAQAAARVPAVRRSGGLLRRFRGRTLDAVGEAGDDFLVGGVVAACPGPAEVRDGVVVWHFWMLFQEFKKFGLSPQ